MVLFFLHQSLFLLHKTWVLQWKDSNLYFRWFGTFNHAPHSVWKSHQKVSFNLLNSERSELSLHFESHFKKWTATFLVDFQTMFAAVNALPIVVKRRKGFRKLRKLDNNRSCSALDWFYCVLCVGLNMDGDTYISNIIYESSLFFWSRQILDVFLLKKFPKEKFRIP